MKVEAFEKEVAMQAENEANDCDDENVENSSAWFVFLLLLSCIIFSFLFIFLVALIQQLRVGFSPRNKKMVLYGFWNPLKLVIMK